MCTKKIIINNKIPHFIRNCESFVIFNCRYVVLITWCLVQKYALILLVLIKIECIYLNALSLCLKHFILNAFTKILCLRLELVLKDNKNQMYFGERFLEK